MLSARINPDKCLVKTPYIANIFENIKSITKTRLIISRMLAHCQDDEQRENINSYLTKHIGDGSIFEWLGYQSAGPEQARVKQYLSNIIAAIEGQIPGLKISPDRISAMMNKLTEDIDQCRAGYVDRTYVVMGSMQQPQSIDELLSAYRLQLIEKAYLSSGIDEVHAHHRFYVVANALGYAIPYEEVNDPYRGAIKDDDIQKKLIRIFNEWYVPDKIVKHIWEQAGLDMLGYVGKKEVGKGYVVEDYDSMLAYFRKVFENPALTYADCFVVDDETSEILDIDWLSIQSQLICYFKLHEYFTPFVDKVKFAHGKSLTYTCSKNALRDGLLVYRDANGRLNYQYGLDAENALFKQIPSTLQNKLNEWLKQQVVASINNFALLKAIKTDNYKLTKKLLGGLEAKKSLKWKKTTDGNTVLHHAVLNRNAAMITLLIQHGADVTKKNKDGKTAIQLAAEKNQWSCVNVFADNKQDANGESLYCGALILAVMENKEDTVARLLKATADLTWVTKSDRNGVLHHAVFNRNPVMIARLIQHGADVTKKNKAGKTAIQLAAKRKQWDCVNAFADNKQDVNYKANYGSALLDAVKANRGYEAASLLKANAASTWQTTKTGNGVLHHAVLNNNPAMIALLIQQGANVAKKNKDGKTAIQLAAENKQWECVNAFADNKQDVNDEAKYSDALIEAVKANREYTVAKLLKAKASLMSHTANDEKAGSLIVHSSSLWARSKAYKKVSDKDTYLKPQKISMS